MNEQLRYNFVETLLPAGGTYHNARNLLVQSIREYCIDDIREYCIDDIRASGFCSAISATTGHSTEDDIISMIVTIITVTCAHDVAAHDALNVLIHNIRQDIRDEKENIND